MLDKLPEGEQKAERLGVLLQQLCQFCDETLATSLRLEHAAVSDKINSMRAALYTWYVSCCHSFSVPLSHLKTSSEPLSHYVRLGLASGL